MLYIRRVTTLQVQLPDEIATRIKEVASERGFTVDEFVAKSLEEKLVREATFETAVEAVLAENAELYKRLA